MRFSEKILAVEPSATLGITSKAKVMSAAGEDVVIMAAGETDFDTPDVIKNAGIKAIKEGYTRYTPASGSKPLKEAICLKLRRDNGLDYETGEIVVSNGAKHSLFNILQIICNPGDEILIIPPYWLSYPEMVKLAGAKPEILPMNADNGFKVRLKDIRSAITRNTRALIINSPSNPAGVVYEKKELEGIADLCVNAGITIISDEIYEKIIFDGKKHFSIASVSDKARAATIVVNGVSKSHSMTGWRIGYLAADRKIAEKVSALQSHSTSNPCSISQAAAECALRTDMEDMMRRNSAIFQERRDVLMECLSGGKKLRPFKPEGAFYLFCDISACGLDSLTFATRLLAEKKVAVIPGGSFGADGFIRISFAMDVETMKKGIIRLKDWVDNI
ncbi:MAG: pyridoxal phosphate-dependent aminotransferase [Candidatus Omnitrophota bacterium]